MTQEEMERKAEEIADRCCSRYSERIHWQKAEDAARLALESREQEIDILLRQIGAIGRICRGEEPEDAIDSPTIEAVRELYQKAKRKEQR